MATKQMPPQREVTSIPTNRIDQFVIGPMTAEAFQNLSMAFKKALSAELGVKIQSVVCMVHPSRV
jgi:hypothetical protein